MALQEKGNRAGLRAKIFEDDIAQSSATKERRCTLENLQFVALHIDFDDADGRFRRHIGVENVHSYADGVIGWAETRWGGGRRAVCFEVRSDFQERLSTCAADGEFFNPEGGAAVPVPASGALSGLLRD